MYNIYDIPRSLRDILEPRMLKIGRLPLECKPKSPLYPAHPEAINTRCSVLFLFHTGILVTFCLKIKFAAKSILKGTTLHINTAFFATHVSHVVTLYLFISLYFTLLNYFPGANADLKVMRMFWVSTID